MSSSGYRGRSFGPRGARANGPTNGYNGPRFPHPSFNHPRVPHRLPGLDKWIERSNFVPWQQNNNFTPPTQHYRGNLQFRPNGRGRISGNRGIVRFSGPGRPPGPQFYMGYKRNPILRAPLPQDELLEDKATLVSQTPLLGSEEERLQKISETADKLKQKLSSITEEELTNFWEDDLSILSNAGIEEENTQRKGIPELRHEPPELDLTFTDFRDIGRVDCSNSKFDNVDNICGDQNSTGEAPINIDPQPTDKDVNTSDEIIIIHDTKEDCITILDSTHDEHNFDEPNILSDADDGVEQTYNELPAPECIIHNIQLHDDNVADNLLSPNTKDGKSSPVNLVEEDITNSVLLEKNDDVTVVEKPLDTCDPATSVVVAVPGDQEELNFSQAQSSDGIDTQEENQNVDQDVNSNIHQNHQPETKLHESNQFQNNFQTNVAQKSSYQNAPDLCEPPQNVPFNVPCSNEEIHSSITSDLPPAPYSTYNDVHKSNEDKKLNKPPIFQQRVFSTPPRFAPRSNGPPRCPWPFSSNGKNLFFRGSQRLPFHGNKISPPTHVPPLPPGFNPRAPPPFTSGDLPPIFDPSEPPPNIRPIAETCSRQTEEVQTVSSLDPRSQVMNSHNGKIAQPIPDFDPREPPPRIPTGTLKNNEKLPEFNPQQPPPRIHKQEETLQPPPIFDPRLSSQERSNLIAPLDSTRANLMSMSQMTDFSLNPVGQNFSQLPPTINMAPHQTLMPNVQMNFQPVLSQASNGPIIMGEFALPPPPIGMAEVPPPPPKQLLLEESTTANQNINMDDGLEDMQEAMEFAKQIMNMTGKTGNENESSLIPSYISVPHENASKISVVEEENVGTAKKQKRREFRSKKGKQNVVCGPEFIIDKQGEVETIDEEQDIQNQSKSSDDALLSSDQIRPKVIFNLNTKTKKIQKPEEWHRSAVSVPENKESSHQGASHNSSKSKSQSRKHSSEARKDKDVTQNKSKRESSAKVNSIHTPTIINDVILEKVNERSHCKSYNKISEKLHAYSSTKVASSDTSTQQTQKTKKDGKKLEGLTSEASWKNRVISRFLKMSKNDICNMVNNSSLRKFDIAMKHLVKERRSSLSLEMRNTEDEKMKEYDREEFMTQLNAMLDPSAVVAITDLPTEFIHHLSEVLQLDRIPLDNELSETPSTNTDGATIVTQSEVSLVRACEYSDEETGHEVQATSEYLESQETCEERREVEEKFSCNKEKLHYSINRSTQQLTSNPPNPQQDSISSQRSLSVKVNPEVESTHKKQQQPLFNEADLDDILSEVTEKTKQFNNSTAPPLEEREKNTDTCTSLLSSSSVGQTVITEAFDYNTFPQIPNKTAADLDDIFSAGIARVRLLGKTSMVDADRTRPRKSSSEDRNTFRSERYERWHRKERDDPDAFRNLTKEEWEAKYGTSSVVASSSSSRKSASNSAENLSNIQAQKCCSSASPARRLSLSPITADMPMFILKKSHTMELEDLRRAERFESSSDSNTSSTSDSDEETVSPNVTKLLKVIKEKEKIAKKRSLNETIRDEVAAEIEKKWKEKSRYKERKSRKRDRRKKDKRDKKKKEKKRKLKRNSHSDSSKSCENLDGPGLLTEDEIKKEIIVKEEPMSSFEERMDNTYAISTSVDSIIDTHMEAPALQERKDLPVITCDMVLLQSKSKVTTACTLQPKTKAQLKQMPDVSDMEMQISEDLMEPTEVCNAMSNIAENMRAKEPEAKSLDRVIIKGINEQTDSASSVSTSTSSQQISISSSNSDASSSSQTYIERSSSKNTIPLTLAACNNSSTATVISTVVTQCADSNAPASGTSSSNENRSGGIKKIDIKAYKERTLQRRLKEEAVLKENQVNSITLAQGIQTVTPASKVSVEPANTSSEIKRTEVDTNKVHLKDPRLARIRSAGASSVEESNKEDKPKEKPLERECQGTHLEGVQRVIKESLLFTQQKSTGEKNATPTVEFVPNTLKESVQRVEPPNQNHNKPLAQDTVSSRSAFDLKKLTSPVDKFKFKNIRSEGSKELKLKKEKARKALEKKKKDLKQAESKSLVLEEHVDKYSHNRVPEESQECPIGAAAIQDETENTSGRDVTREDTTESETKSSIDNRTVKQETDICPIVQSDNPHCIITDIGLEDINKKSVDRVQETIHVMDQKLIGKKVDQVSVNLEKKQIRKATCVDTEATTVSSILTTNENLHMQTDKSHSSEKFMENMAFHDAENIDNCLRPLSEHLTAAEILKNVSSTNTDPSGEFFHKSGDTNSEQVPFVKQCQNTKQSGELLIVGASNINNEVAGSKARSPDSPSSPFKGFLADTVEGTVCQGSDLYSVDIESKDSEENLRNISKQWLESCLNDELISESEKNEEQIGKPRAEENKMKENQIVSNSNLIEKENDISEMIQITANVTLTRSSLDITHDISVHGKLEVDGRALCDREEHTSNVLLGQKKTSTALSINSHDIIHENSEPFIVLDEYIDDADGKSMEKLTSLDLDLEECIARDTDIFANKCLQVEQDLADNNKCPDFNSLDFKELSDVFVKSNCNVDAEKYQTTMEDSPEKYKNSLCEGETILPTEIFPPEEGIKNATNVVSSTSESNTELSLKISEIGDLTQTTNSEVPVESSQNMITTTSKDIAQTPSREDDYPCTYGSEHTLEQVSKTRDRSRSVVTFFETDITHAAPLKSNGETNNKQGDIQNSVNNILINAKAESGSDKIISDSSNPVVDGEANTGGKTIWNKSNQTKRRGNSMHSLRKVRSKSKMKHKKQKLDISDKMLKEVVKSDTVKMKFPSTKEAIMARMIEIDVEIHKLMTEKMTLYQMLTNDAVPGDNNLQQDGNLMSAQKEVENTVMRPRTPSALMSQLIHNIETSPATNQCAKLTAENASTKDKRGNHASVCGSDEAESSSHASEDNRASISKRRRRRRKSETVVKKVQTDKSKQNIEGGCDKDKENVNTEKEQITDAQKLSNRRTSNDRVTWNVDQESSQASVNETQALKEVDNLKISSQEIAKEDSSSSDKVEVSKCEEVEKAASPIEPQTFLEEVVQSEETKATDENSLTKALERDVASNEKSIAASSPARLAESKTPERSSIYSDDSTWDSLLQTPNMDEQKKPSTGLALLEETYRKEMAKSRKVKAEARRRKKSKQSIVHSLTPEEEELPLSALYVRKFQQKKKILSFLDQQRKPQENEEPHVWTNLDHIINAVAENRTEELYVEVAEQLPATEVRKVAITPVPEETFESKEIEECEAISSTTLKNTKEYMEDSVVCENKIKISSYQNQREDSVPLVSGKLQECANSECHKQDAPASDTKDTLDTPISSTPISTDNSLQEFSAEQTVVSDNVDIEQKATMGDMNDPCIVISNVNNAQDNHKEVFDILENQNADNVDEEKVEKVDIEKKEPIDHVIETTENPIQESINTELVTPSKNAEESIPRQESIKSDSDFDKQEDISNSALQDVNETNDKSKNREGSTPNEKDNNSENAVELSYVSEDGHFTDFQEHKELHIRKETDCSSTASSEENNNQNSASVSTCSENTSTNINSEEAPSKKFTKRKRGSSRTPLRRSSRYVEEPMKRIKLEVNVPIQNLEPELHERNCRMQLPNVSSTSSSPCEEIENILTTNLRKSRGGQKSAGSRKRCTPMSVEPEIVPLESIPSDEQLIGVKRCKRHTMSEMMNCVVKLVDCRYTFLNPNVCSKLLQSYGISKVNPYVYYNSMHIDSFVSSMHLMPVKEPMNLVAKQTGTVPNDFSQIQTSKLIKKSDNTVQPIGEQTNPTKVKKVLQPVKTEIIEEVDVYDKDKEDCADADDDIEIMPVLTKEPVIVDISCNFEKPDIEIVEEKMIVTKNQQHSNSGLTLTVIDIKEDKELPRTQYTVHKGPILDIKVFENSFLAASEDGRIYRYNQASNGILNIYKGHKAAVTCLYVNASSTDINRECMFSGSLDGTLRCYNVLNGIQVRDTVDIGSPIQCMDEAWGIVFIGTKSGHVSRYHMKSGIIKGNSIQFSDKSVLALRATNEGPRRVLIVASRSQPITIRDAQSGLFLRTICGQKSHTVYSLMRDNNLIYCGTSSTSIPVFDFTNGEQTMQYDAGVGIVCMRLYKQLLFAGCYDGNIYVFDTKDHRLICSIPGPGNMLLSMEVIDNKIIAGSKDKRLQSWKMPLQVRSLL